MHWTVLFFNACLSKKTIPVELIMHILVDHREEPSGVIAALEGFGNKTAQKIYDAVHEERADYH